MKRKNNHSPRLSEEKINKVTPELSSSKMNMPKIKKPLTILPTNQLLNQIWEYLLTRPNKKGETKKAEHECLFLLC